MIVAVSVVIVLLIGICIAGMVELTDGCFSRARAARRAAPTAGYPGCTCEERFYPDALDARCPHHGIFAYVQQAEADARCGDAA